MVGGPGGVEGGKYAFGVYSMEEKNLFSIKMQHFLSNVFGTHYLYFNYIQRNMYPFNVI